MSLKRSLYLIVSATAVVLTAFGYTLHWLESHSQRSLAADHMPMDGIMTAIGAIGVRGIVTCALLALVVIILLGVWVAFRALREINSLRDYCVPIDKTDKVVRRLAPTRRDEVGRLAGEIDRVVDMYQVGIRDGKKRESQLRDHLERHVLALNGTSDHLFEWDLGASQITLYDRQHPVTEDGHEGIVLPIEDWLGRIHSEARPAFEAAVANCIQSGAPNFSSEHRVTKQEDEYTWASVRGVFTPAHRGKPKRIVGFQSDITTRKEKEEVLSRQALYDTLTTLGSRSLLIEQLEHAIQRTIRNKEYAFALMFLDLDGFKVVNDGLGHLVGDELLKGVADKLRSSVRSTDTVGRCGSTIARLGGDEFVILLDDIHDVADPIRVAERIQRILSKPFNIQGHEIFTSTSIGIAVGREGRGTAEDLLRHADTALYRAKAKGRACYAVFDMQMEARARKQLRLETDLRRALESNEMVLHYQPIISFKTGRITSFEALIRWRHPEFGLITPDDFLDVAEETGAIIPIGRWMLAEACRQTRVWQETFSHARDLGINMNLSAKEVYQPDIIEFIKSILQGLGLSPRCLNIEITEKTMIQDTGTVKKTLEELRALEMQLSLDDFGTGYSSLSYLSKFPVSNVKIDLTFTRQLPGSMPLVKSILSLAQNLGLTVTVEGIETPAQLALLRDLNCTDAQGYYFSKPVDAETATRQLAINRSW